MKKSIIYICCSIFMCLFLFSCSEEIEYSQDVPNLEIMESEPELDFNLMHNFVIDSISSQYSPFFFVKNNMFDISGDNDKKTITVSCTCIQGTTVDDVDLFLSLVLNYIAINAAEQDFRFKTPTIDSDGTYLDFGTVFNEYSLIINADTDDGKILRNNTIQAGKKIPVDSRYWRE